MGQSWWQSIRCVLAPARVTHSCGPSDMFKHAGLLTSPSKLVPTCRHSIPPVGSQHWATWKQAATHFESQATEGGGVGNSAMQHGQLPFGLRVLASRSLHPALQLVVDTYRQVPASPHSVFGLCFSFPPFPVLLLLNNRSVAVLTSGCMGGVWLLGRYLWRLQFTAHFHPRQSLELISCSELMFLSALLLLKSCFLLSYFSFITPSLKGTYTCFKYFPLLNQRLCMCMQTHKLQTKLLSCEPLPNVFHAVENAQQKPLRPLNILGKAFNFRWGNVLWGIWVCYHQYHQNRRIIYSWQLSFTACH